MISQILIKNNSLSSDLQKKIIFCWISSHVGIKENEKADQAASLALNEHISNIKLPYSDFKHIISQYITKCWQDICNKDISNKIHSIKPIVKENVSLHSFFRKEDVVITRLCLGHSYITHSYILNNNPAPICQHCNTLLTISHILLICPMFSNQRSNLCSAHNMAQFFSKNVSGNILNFLYDSNIFMKI